MKNMIKRVVVIVGLVLIGMLILGNNKVEAASAGPVLEVKKYNYDEANNEFVVQVNLKANSTLKKYVFSMSYDTNLVKVIPYGNTVATGSGADMQLNEFGTIGVDKNAITYGGGLVYIESEELTNEVLISATEEICLIRFKLLGNTTILEENTTVLDNLFKIDIIEITDDTTTETSNDLVQINKMSKAISSISITNPIFDKSSYRHGDNINLVGGTLTIHYTNAASTAGATRTINLATTSLDGLSIGPWIADYNNPSVNVSYKGKSTLVGVTVTDYVENISMKNPNKDTYCYGSSLDLTGAEVYIKMASKASSDTKTLQSLVDSGVATINGFDSTTGPNQIVVQTVYVNINYQGYTFNSSFDVKIKDGISMLDIIYPDKTEYEYNESKLDLSGGKIIITMYSGTVIERELPTIPLINSSNVLRTMRTAINLNDELEVLGFDSTQHGIQTITLNYFYDNEDGIRDNVQFQYDINIKAIEKSIDLNNNKITIQYGHIITESDLTNYKIVITKTDLSTQEIPLTADMITYNKNGNIGVQTGYVTYNGKQIPFYIELTNYVESIKLSNASIVLLYGKTLDSALTNEYKIIPIMANGDIGNAIDLTADKIDGIYNANQEGSYNVKVKMFGKETDFVIIVRDKIIGIKLENSEKDKIQSEYKYNEDLILNNAQLTVIKLSGEFKIDLTREMIKNYNQQKVGLQELDIEYAEQELKGELLVDVKDYIVDIILIKPTKTSYLPNEKLDLTGATVRTLSASGVLGQPVAVTLDMISGYDENVMGAQRLIVNYEGFEKNFEIIIGVQTGYSNTSVYTILSSIAIIASIICCAILTIQKMEIMKNTKM